MVNVKELRIGNLVKYPKYWGDREITVSGVSIVDRRDDHTGIYEEFIYFLNDFVKDKSDFDSFVDYKNGVMNPDDIIPIPLTEEWLLRFGFEKAEGFIYRLVNPDLNYAFSISFTGNGYNTTTAITRLPIKFVHQLQNLYFALTNEELSN